MFPLFNKQSLGLILYHNNTMKIYIPTLGRSDKQITFSHLPKFLQDKTTLVVQPHEKHLYDNYPIMVLPKDWMGISRTRKYIIDNAGNNIFGIMDDDIELKRRFSESPTKRPLTEEVVKDVFHIQQLLSEIK